MEELVYYSELYDLYQNLLTEKQKQYFEEYYFDNLSFQEIADHYQISRNAVYRQVKFTKELLDDYEQKLQLRKKREGLEKVLDDSSLSMKIRDILEK